MRTSPHTDDSPDWPALAHDAHRLSPSGSPTLGTVIKEIHMSDLPLPVSRRAPPPPPPPYPG